MDRPRRRGRRDPRHRRRRPRPRGRHPLRRGTAPEGRGAGHAARPGRTRRRRTGLDHRLPGRTRGRQGGRLDRPAARLPLPVELGGAAGRHPRTVGTHRGGGGPRPVVLRRRGQPARRRRGRPGRGRHAGLQRPQVLLHRQQGLRRHRARRRPGGHRRSCLRHRALGQRGPDFPRRLGQHRPAAHRERRRHPRQRPGRLGERGGLRRQDLPAARLQHPQRPHHPIGVRQPLPGHRRGRPGDTVSYTHL